MRGGPKAAGRRDLGHNRITIRGLGRVLSMRSRVPAWPPDVNVRPPSLVVVLEEQWMPLVRLATLLTGDADAARDVVQDCLEGVLRLRPDVDDTAHLVAWPA